MLWPIFFFLFSSILVFWAIARFYLAGPELSSYDFPVHDTVRPQASEGAQQVVENMRILGREMQAASGSKSLSHSREVMDRLGDEADLSTVSISPIDIDGMYAEWVVPADSTANDKRLLYVHGGAFMMGSPKSHRAIVADIVTRTGLSALLIDYRLMPENARKHCIEDCQKAYRWILENGPQNSGPTDQLFVAGDSAGGNLTLMLLAWARDNKLRQASGAIALSPIVDSGLSGSAIQKNARVDPLLGTIAKIVNRTPRALLMWLLTLQNRMRPANPLLSPIYGDLSGLPPLLIQASESEILIDDARRYVNKARAQGSPAELETWHGMVHVWQGFGRDLPEAEEAYNNIANFVQRVNG
ncbi:MAG: alpha/beta hydrolase [Pseudomonadales bacterium]